MPFRGTHGIPQELRVQVEKDPMAMLMKETTSSPVKMVICGSCGFVEFYVKNPGELASAEAEQHRNWEKRKPS
jgi:hypothetical protein